MAKLSILDSILFGVRRIFWSSTEMPERPGIKFTGDGVSVADNATDNVTVVTIGAGAGAVPTTRKLLVSGGLTVSPSDGVLDQDLTFGLSGINDAQHGSRAGGTLHAAATTSAAGFMSAADKTKLDGLPAAADVATITYVDDAIAALDPGASATASYLINAGTAVNANDIPIQNMPIAAAFARLGGGLTMQISTGGASSPGVYPVLRLLAGNFGAAGGTGRETALVFGGQDDAQDEPDVAQITSYMTDATSGDHAGGLGFYASIGGALVQVGSWLATELSVTTDVTIDGSLTAPRTLSAPSTPASASNAVTLDLSSRDNQVHTVTQATTVTISGFGEGQRGLLIFVQGGTGYTVTMPAASSSIEYTDAIEALTLTGIVSNGVGVKTILEYYVIAGPKILIYSRATSAT
jgi:hypothetical protein